MTDHKAPKPLRPALGNDALSPMPTPFTNSTLHGPPGTDVGDLHCELAVDEEYGSVATVSAWVLTEQQRVWIAAGAHIRMTVWQHPIPPLALAVEPPFCEGEAKNHAPVSMIFVKSEATFACPACGRREGATSESAEIQVRRDFRPADEGEPQG